MEPEQRLWEAGLDELDGAVASLVAAEEHRQDEKIILIPSESLTPWAVREALGSVFTSIYAEGYPREETMRLSEARLDDLEERLAYFRRYADRRFYRGAEFANIAEALACRRAAACFASEALPEEDIYAAIQPLSGAAANMAIYDALLSPGDTVMALDLAQGGHLSHGSPFHQSGRRFNMVRYGVNPKTERLDYDMIEELARTHKPRMIIAGYTSYPWAPNWKAFRQVADTCGALLLADIAHTAGMAIAGAYPNPLPHADVVMFTTHKTLCGPRGAVVLARDPELAKAIETAVFPGAQGGPHVNKFVAIACALAIARTEAFRALQRRIAENAKALAGALTERGLKLAYGGTDTHLMVIDLRGMRTSNGQPLLGDTAARLLDLGGLVANKNTIPGDSSAADARGVRFGTTWVTQRGLGGEAMKEIASMTADILGDVRPFSYLGVTGILPRGKVSTGTLSGVRERVGRLLGTPVPEKIAPPTLLWTPGEAEEAVPFAGTAILVRGGRAAHLLHEACAGRVLQLDPGQALRTVFLDPQGDLLSEAIVGRLADAPYDVARFAVLAPEQAGTRLRAWLEELADGYVLFDPHDVYRKVQGPAVVALLPATTDPEVLYLEDEGAITWAAGRLPAPGTTPFLGIGADRRGVQAAPPNAVDVAKPYFVGQHVLEGSSARQPYTPTAEERPLRQTPLTKVHRDMGARMQAFAGYEMPLWYTSARDEHKAVREAAGLFDLSHMGALEVSGRYAEAFLNLVTSNYAGWLHPGQSHYAFLLTPQGAVIDDVMVYRRARDRFLIVVNAVNEASDWDWLRAVNEDTPLLDPDRPWIAPDGPVTLRDLKARDVDDGRLNLALQGPAARAVLERLLAGHWRYRLRALRRTEFLELKLAGVELLCSRTGYTGEELGYELYVPPQRVEELWRTLLDAGRELGVTPCGLAARDSLRTEAGLPLYGHELAGEHAILPHEAGFAPYVKLHKPFFVGREAYLRALEDWQREVVRFEVPLGGRPVRAGSALLDRAGVVIGRVTSCAVTPDGQVGMALLWRRGVEAGTALAVVMGEALPEGLAPGARLPLLQWGTVIARFPDRETLPQAGPD